MIPASSFIDSPLFLPPGSRLRNTDKRNRRMAALISLDALPKRMVIAETTAAHAVTETLLSATQSCRTKARNRIPLSECFDSFACRTKDGRIIRDSELPYHLSCYKPNESKAFWEAQPIPNFEALDGIWLLCWTRPGGFLP